MTRLRTSPLAPWAGLFVGAFAWFLHHQGGSNANVFDCHVAGSAYVVGLGVACAVLAAAGGLISWRAEVPEPEPGKQNSGFARMVGATSAGIFLLAIAFQTLAGVLVPPCLR